jgi:hypothetical protein
MEGFKARRKKMTKREMTQKMPKFLNNAIGEIQKRLTILEGQARGMMSLMNTTMSKMKNDPRIQKMNMKVSEYQKTMNEKISPLRKKFDKARADMGQKAASVIGVATRADLAAIRSRVNKLADELKKFARGSRNEAKA